MIYFDNNATTAVHAEVLQKMLPWFTEKFGNASSKTHQWGWDAENAVKIARAQVASLIHTSPEEIIFTSGATESINQALQGIFIQFAAKGKHIITVKTEHNAVLDTCDYLEKLGAEITRLRVDAQGVISLEDLKNAIRPDTILVAVMMANNETGVLQPIKEIGAICREHSVLFFSDITQACGKVNVDVDELNIDIACLSAHKFYGPKGVGALYMRRKSPRVQVPPLLHGGGHERGFRSGTLNVPGIVGMGAAAEMAQKNLLKNQAHLQQLKNQLEIFIKSFAVIAGDKVNRLPNTTLAAFKGKKASDILKSLHTIGLSTGSACASENNEPSHVLQAMGYSKDKALSSIRISLGVQNTPEDIDILCQKLEAFCFKK